MKRISATFLLLLAICGGIEARQVKGKVTSGKEKLGGVLVTDGHSFTKTRRNGTFRMNIKDDAEFVYIVTPAGYAADWSEGCPQFYKKAEGEDFFAFDLIKTGTEDDSYHLIAIGDPQPRSDEHFDMFAGEPLDDLCKTAASLRHPGVGIALGDICYDVFPLMKRWKENIPRTGIPVYPVVGNHDHDRRFNSDTLSIAVYREHFGPENYAFRLGKDFVIALDNIIYYSRSGYEEGFTDAIIEWVGKLLEFIPKDSHIYIAQHSPLNGRPYEDFMVMNYEAMMELLKGRQVTFLSGHNHISGWFEYAPGITEHNIAAICGTWWDAYHCTDGTPRGYKVFTKEEDKLSWYYKAVGKPADFQYEIYTPGQTRLHPDCVVVNIWDYDPMWSVEWYEDGKPMGKMQQVEEYSPEHQAEMDAKYKPLGKTPSEYKQTRAADHYFAAKPSADASKVTVVIRNRFGRTWSEDIRL